MDSGPDKSVPASPEAASARTPLPLARPAPKARPAPRARPALPVPSPPPPPPTAGKNPPPARPPVVLELEADEEPPRRWRLAELLYGSGSIFASLAAHLALLVTLGMLIVPEVIEVEPAEILTQILDEREEDDLLKLDLNEQLDPATERFHALPFAAEVGVADADAAAGSSGAGETTVSAPKYDPSVAEAIVGTELSIDAPLADAPPGQALLEAAPPGRFGNERAIVDDYEQAMDQITQEILWFMEKGPVVVIWCFDQSESMKDDQQQIRDRIERVYTELGLTSHYADRLTTAVASFGSSFALHTPSPTSNRDQIRAAIDAIPVDATGQELMCEAVGRSIAHHREYAQKTRRQMLLILVTDESGDVANNNAYLEQAIVEAKAARCRCYVLGREAVFGYPYAHIRWDHPQTRRTHWLPIDRGPETAFVEQLQIDGFRRRYDAHPSGFGPYEQTRLARETGGIFFMLPGLESNLVRGEKRRYELERMRPYRPDLRSRLEIISDRNDSPLRSTLYKVIYDLNPYQPEIAKIIEMRVEFSPDYATFVQQARQEQAKAVVYLDYLAKAQQAVEEVAEYRQQEASPRWQANYDLLYAQLIAYQARIYEYAAYLEQFINEPKKAPLRKDPDLRLIHWAVRTRNQTLTGEVSEPYIAKASQLYERILVEHEGTPWAARAELELRRGFGVELVEVYWSPPPTLPPGTKIAPIPKL